MRVTQKILFGNFLRDVNKNRSEMGRLQSDLSSGKSVRFPSQDPVSFQRSRVIEDRVRKDEQYQSNISGGLRQARASQEALEEMVDRLIDIKTKVIEGASDSSDDQVRENMADEVSSIRESLVYTLNLSSGDRYLFAGTNSAQKPFEFDALAPGGVQNNSNATAPEALVADGVKIEISVSGNDLTNTAAGDTFEVIGNIEQALRDNDTAAINGMISDIDSVIEHTTLVTSRLGSNINRMEFMFEQYESSKIVKKADISELVDTDYAQAFSDLQRVQVAYESAMAVHTTMFNNTLLNYL
jgi:flagellar hook-associated protein 3 FlgL